MFVTSQQEVRLLCAKLKATFPIKNKDKKESEGISIKFRDNYIVFLDQDDDEVKAKEGVNLDR